MISTIISIYLPNHVEFVIISRRIKNSRLYSSIDSKILRRAKGSENCTNFTPSALTRMKSQGVTKYRYNLCYLTL